jgi:hypothetical protein
LPNSSQNPSSGVANFFKQLVEAQEVASRARVIANFAGEWVPDSAACVYTIASEGDENYWVPRAIIGDAAIHEHAIAADSG